MDVSDHADRGHRETVQNSKCGRTIEFSCDSDPIISRPSPAQLAISKIVVLPHPRVCDLFTHKRIMEDLRMGQQ